MNKNINILYFSPTDGTSKVVKAIGNTISNELNLYDLTLPKNRIDKPIFTENDLVIIGTPVYAGRVPRFLTEYFKEIKGNNTLAVFIVTYGNRDYEDALLELKDTFEHNGFKGIAAATFVAEHSTTELVGTARPNVDDLKIAQSFGMQIKEKLERLEDGDDVKTLTVPGNFPYVVKDMVMPSIAPETNNSCIQCGFCAKHCPTAAIDFANCKITDATKCIKCRSCVKRCPKNAKEITHPSFRNMQTLLISNFSKIARQPELYMTQK